MSDNTTRYSVEKLTENLLKFINWQRHPGYWVQNSPESDKKTFCGEIFHLIFSGEKNRKWRKKSAPLQQHWLHKATDCLEQDASVSGTSTHFWLGWPGSRVWTIRFGSEAGHHKILMQRWSGFWEYYWQQCWPGFGQSPTFNFASHSFSFWGESN